MSKTIEWLSVNELCVTLGITRSTFDRWLKKGEVPPYRRLPSGKLLFHPADVQEWLDQFLVVAR